MVRTTVLKTLNNRRLSLLKAIFLQFTIISAIVRLSLYVWSFSEIELSITHLVRVFFTGSFYDLGVISFFSIPYIFYLMFLPDRWSGSRGDRLVTYFYYAITTIIITFSFFAEFTFWGEFQNRFNFIAVDYLVYTNEVIANINESYPIPLLFAIILSVDAVLFYILSKRFIFKYTFEGTLSRLQKAGLILVLMVPVSYVAFVQNNDAEWSDNRYENELSKAGIYSVFAAFRNNELSYTDFYDTQNLKTTFATLRSHLTSQQEKLSSKDLFDIKRTVTHDSIEVRPNVIFICIESLSAEFLTHFGNTSHITPTLDTLLENSVYFENIYATGTRTVRGMEAITLSVPPSPGRSIVKRIENHGLHNIGEVFEQKGYSRTFFYGGDGYFDNMNSFFGGNGFNIVDRGRGYLLGDSFDTKRSNIEDDEVTFENAWGVCDEDVYSRVIKEADKSFSTGKPFFNFIMTTSNHRPYTYPEGKIDIPSGSGRNGAVKYTDYAIRSFLNEARQKPWFKNTVFVIMADHCASSAGKWELNVSKYRIPAIIYNMPGHEPHQLSVQCSQIDLFPTLFGYLNWNYETFFYGRDVNTFDKDDQRAFIGNYRKLGLLKGDTLTVLGDQKQHNFYLWDKATNRLILQPENRKQLTEIISYYQSIDYLYKHGLLKKMEKG
ncbi:sulfatase-like hydrolase/transferase [Fulvivirga sp. 29W222]|uniref:Sulfatase-like hydrolase/transferase n=1 Tax=Fulvivirga marina TaxID=2494733 RepID=A0A937KDL7_9BACT|nr:LTA synthase family protein [Fulvivirga marina]MBL6448757.1 sulfatase-like hydrolase/transferase [Fulvivirga marina]